MKEEEISHSFPQISWDLTVNTLIVNIIIFGQAVLNVFYVGRYASNEQLAHAHRREYSVFYSACDQSIILQPVTCLSSHHP